MIKTMRSNGVSLGNQLKIKSLIETFIEVFDYYLLFLDLTRWLLITEMHLIDCGFVTMRTNHVLLSVFEENTWILV